MVGHNSGGLIARHAVAGDPRLRAMGLIDTEQPHGLSLRFRQFVAAGRVPGFGAALGWAVGSRRLRRTELLLGGAFTDRSLLDGSSTSSSSSRSAANEAAVTLLRSFDQHYVHELTELHQKITAPVQLVWGEDDPFFPARWAQEMVATFPRAQLHLIPGARLFSHEEKPTEVASALLPVLEPDGG